VVTHCVRFCPMTCIPTGKRRARRSKAGDMALMSPATTEADVGAHTEVFAQAASELLR
jgi:hypothetical protein